MLNVNFEYYKHLFIYLLTLGVLSLFLYYGSLDVPFYLDDYESIVQSRILQELDSVALWNSPRPLGLATFFWQYQLGFDSPQAIHFINNLIHAANASLVAILTWLLAKKVVKEPTHASMVALVCGLLFAIHPLNSQPVVYAIQRYTLLCTLFYLLSLISFVWARNKLSSRLPLLAIVGFVATTLFALLAYASKQTAASIILALFVIEVVFFSASLSNKKLGALIASLLGLALLALAILPSNIIDALDSASRETTDISRLEYLTVQSVVVLGYIGKFLWPIGQQLEYSVSLQSYSSWQVAGAAFIHLSLLITAFLCRVRLPLVCLAIFFYYIGLSVESSVIPIRDLAFEHRTYLANVGLCLLAAFGYSQLFISSAYKRVIALTSCSLLVLLSYLTYERVSLWQDRVAFYENEYELNPRHTRVLSNLGLAYIEQDQREKGKSFLEKAAKLSSNNLRPDVGSNYLAMLVEDGNFENAKSLGEELLKKVKNQLIRSRIDANMGIAYLNTNELTRAEKHLHASLKQQPQQENILYALLITQIKLNKMLLALETSEALLKLNPNHEQALSIYPRLKALADRQNISG
ncbi:tetratricopeptide repeat protein [Pseudoalteromonas sp. GB56]